MAEPYLAEIRIMSFGYAPKAWALCDGQLLPIDQNQALFSLLGTTFGGDGRVSFGLPDLRARTPVHVGGGHALGDRAGEQAHALSIAEIPQHLHGIAASTKAANGSATANQNFLGAANNVYRSPAGGALTTLHPATVSTVGRGQPHENMQPYLTLTFCIALQGIFPSRN